MARSASRDQGGNGGRGSKWIRPAKRAALYESDAHRCVYCGRDLRAGHASARTLDHLVPRELGGGNYAQNLLTCCLTCNAQRRAMPLGAWLSLLARGGQDRRALARRVDAARRRHAAMYPSDVARELGSK